MRRFKRVLGGILAACMVVGNMPAGMAPVAVYADPASNLPVMNGQINFIDITSGDASADASLSKKDVTHGWSWDKESKTLTLEDGFHLNYSGADTALKLVAGTTILLKGNATIKSNTTAIEVFGNLTIKSADGVNGYLDLEVRDTNANHYAVKMSQREGTLAVTDNTIVKLNGGGTSLYLGQGTSGAKATVSVRNKSVLQLTGASHYAENFWLHENGERVIWVNGVDSTAKLLKETEERDIEGNATLTMMSCTIDGTLSTAAGTDYALTYDGKEHPLKINTNTTGLSRLQVPDINIVPAQVKYDESYYSEFRDNSKSDYRDKFLEEVTTNYTPFTTTAPGPKNAAEYEIQYGTKGIATLNIRKRKVTVEGLKAKDKTYDGWDDAEIDYSNFDTFENINKYIKAVNDDTNTDSAKKEQGIVDADEGKIGQAGADGIVLYAKAYFLRKRTSADSNLSTKFKDAETDFEYVRCGDVEYLEDPEHSDYTDAEKEVKTKLIKIDEISLSDPNYEVVAPDQKTTVDSPVSQVTIGEPAKLADPDTNGEAKVYPRSIKKADDSTISCVLGIDQVYWRTEGYFDSPDEYILESVTDKSPITGKNHGNEVTLKKNKDYRVNPNTNNLSNVGEYTIVFTGIGNYTGTRRLPWNITKAATKITIEEAGVSNKADSRIYDGTAYEIQPANASNASNAGGFTYKIEDVSYANKIDLTGSLEEGANLKITYKGKKADGSDYEESEVAPKDAGTYEVTVKIDETAHYASADATLKYTIQPKTVELDWSCADGSVAPTEVNPEKLVYNGTANTFTAAVKNAVEGDTVGVTKYEYSGKTEPVKYFEKDANGTYVEKTVGGTAYASANATKDAGDFTVRAAELNDPNYQIGNDAATKFEHTYTVEQAPVSVTWSGEGTFTYDTADHTPKATVNDLFGGDDCELVGWSYTGKDVFGQGYSPVYTASGNGAVNASTGEITVTATILSNPNYKLAENVPTAAVKIERRSLSELVPGTEDQHDSEKGIFAKKILFSSKIEEPKIVWSHMVGDAPLSTDLYKSTDEVTRDYTATLSTKAVEHDEDPLGMRIKLDGCGNYVGDITLFWNVDKRLTELTVTNTDFTDGTEFTYGEALPELTFKEEYNQDIKRDYTKSLEDFLKITYKGTLIGGQSYESSVAPTKAGDYHVLIELSETDHYLGDVVDIGFKILPRKFTISGGVKGTQKAYDGTTDAKLDLSGITFDNLVSGDAAAVTEALAGKITYTANYSDKDVEWANDANYNKYIANKTITFGNLAVSNDATAEILNNYVLDGEHSQSSVDNGRIVPAEVKVTSGITAKDKVYSGTSDAELILSGAVISGVASGDALKVRAKGTFQTKDASGNSVASKDVSLDSAGNPAAKTVAITDLEILADGGTKLDNYTLAQTGNQDTTTAVITPAELKVTGITAQEKIYDASADAKLDWTNATIEGLYRGETAEVVKSTAPEYGTYRDANVAINKAGTVIDKTSTVPVDSVELKGIANYNKDNYVVTSITFTGKITKKEIHGVKWRFDKKIAGDIPTAYYVENSGICAGDEVVPVIRYYEAVADNTFGTPIEKTDLVDFKNYVARIEGVDNSNYSYNPEDNDLQYPFTYRGSKEESNLRITGYQDTITYSAGSSEDTFNKLNLVFDYTNEDIKDESEAAKKQHFSYRYTGTTRRGTIYDSASAPTQAGVYRVTVTLEETSFFKSSEASVSFRIVPAEVTILQGVTVVDKLYSGTNQAVLNFANVAFDGLMQGDTSRIHDMFLAAKQEYIDYTAAYAQKDVRLSQGAVADIEVTASGYSFILDSTTPDVLYNYTIAAEGNLTSLTGKILPLPVTVSGITAKDKAYDGTADASLDLTAVTFTGVLRGEELKAEVSGIYQITGTESAASDVLLDADGKAMKKNIVLSINELKAGNTTTNAVNYILAQTGQQTTATAKIVPAAVTIQSGLTAKDKVYDGTTAASLNVSGAVFDGMTAADRQALAALLSEGREDLILYEANFEKKDVAWTASGDGTKVMADVAVNASKFAFAQTAAAPKFLSNYAIADSGNQADIKGKILAKEVTISGIKAADKTYDGTKNAVLDLSSVVISGTVGSEKLAVDVTGSFRAEAGTAAEDVLLDQDSKAASKKVDLFINELKAVDAATVAGNYVLASGQQTETTAKIVPAEITIKSGISAQNKVYDGTKGAGLDFSSAVLEGAVAAEAAQVAALVQASGDSVILCNAEYAQKDVAWVEGANGTRTAGDIAVAVTNLAFAQTQTTPKLLANYTIAASGNQSDIKGKILPKAVTVSGIKASDKSYDGLDTAEADLSEASFAGQVGDDKLAVEVTGKFIVTGKEMASGDVLIAKDAETQKKVVLTIGKLTAGNNGTAAENYSFAQEGQQIETTAVIRPAVLSSVTWSFDEKTQLPSAAFQVESAGTPVISIYAQTDTTFAAALQEAQLVKGNSYIARVEGTNNTNYAISDSFTNPLYAFTYGKKEEPTEQPTEQPSEKPSEQSSEKATEKSSEKATEKATEQSTQQTKTETVTAAQKAAAVLALNKGLSLKWSSNKLTLKWGKVSGASGYYVYYAKVGKSYGKAVTVKSSKTSYSVTQKSKTAKYKAYVKAYKVVNGKKVVLAKSYALSCGGSSVYNYTPTKVKVKASTVSLAKGKSVNAGASIQVKKKVTKNKKTTTKTVTKTGTSAALTYWSTNTKIATVSSTGKIKAKKAGTCTIYVMARNGLKKKIKVTVK